MRFLFAGLIISALVALAPARAQTLCEATWIDAARGNRAVPVRIRMPAGTGRAPVILFSHGLGGSLDAGTDWVAAWQAAGFITVNIQHHGSDDAIWRGKARPLQGLRGAMNADQLKARAGDVHFVLDRIARGGMAGACNLGRADMARIGMSGHSFGAQTTLAISGARYGGQAALADPRIKASVAFSPQPAKGQSDQAAFGGIRIPFFTVTGTRDSMVLLSGVTANDRLRPYEAMPPGAKYLLVIDGANHMMLGGQQMRMRNATPPPGMERTVTEATTLFWRATLMGDTRARAALNAFVPAKGDRFERK